MIWPKKCGSPTVHRRRSSLASVHRPFLVPTSNVVIEQISQLRLEPCHASFERSNPVGERRSCRLGRRRRQDLIALSAQTAARAGHSATEKVHPPLLALARPSL